MTNEYWIWFAATAIGMAAGAAYFRSLWWTVERLRDSSDMKTFAISTLARMAILMVVFWICLQWGITSLMLALVGFGLVRWISTSRVKRELQANSGLRSKLTEVATRG